MRPYIVTYETLLKWECPLCFRNNYMSRFQYRKLGPYLECSNKKCRLLVEVVKPYSYAPMNKKLKAGEGS